MQTFDAELTWANPPDNPDLQPGQVDIWRIHLDFPTATVQSLESILSAEETQQVARFHFAADRKRYIAAHGCLRDILARYLGREPTEFSFSTNEYGKPFLQKYPLEFNLSHSGDFALIAVTQQHNVGVDVERIRADIDLEHLAERFFSKSETSELATLPPQQRIAGFFHCWTRKEAYIKAQGLGLSLPLESFDVSLTPGKPAVLRATRPDSKEASRWTLLSLDVDPCHAGAVAVDRKDPGFQLWDWNQ